MPNIVDRQGYATEGYAVENYTQAAASHGVRGQVEMVIQTVHPLQSQTEQRIDGQHLVASQAEQRIDIQRPVYSQTEQRIDAVHTVQSQIARLIDGGTHAVFSQVDQKIIGQHTVKTQTEQRIDDTHTVASQVDQSIGNPKAVGTQIRFGKLEHRDCAGYASQAYGTQPYAAPNVCVILPSQVDMVIATEHPVKSQATLTVDDTHTVKSQVEQRIDSVKALRTQIDRFINFERPLFTQIDQRIDTERALLSQTEQRIDTQRSLFSQINRARKYTLASQIQLVLYNTTNLRILCDFPSRGTSGTNWTASSTEPGDFSPYNLNTDIEEQLWRTATGNITGITLTCDTEVAQGVFVDTLAIRNHNLTTSATVVWERSNDPGFATVDPVPLTVTDTNIYWIADTLPNVSYRYHRFQINDPTNTANNFLSIGTILFGSSIIFQGECFVDQVTRQTISFADKIETEGYTNVTNDRALKFGVGLDFRSLQFNAGNYTRMRGIFEYARTTLKCLWIPTPQYPSRYAVFGKLSSIPVERHNDRGADADYISFAINVDESL